VTAEDPTLVVDVTNLFCCGFDDGVAPNGCDGSGSLCNTGEFRCVTYACEGLSSRSASAQMPSFSLWSSGGFLVWAIVSFTSMFYYDLL